MVSGAPAAASLALGALATLAAASSSRRSRSTASLRSSPSSVNRRRSTTLKLSSCLESDNVPSLLSVLPRRRLNQKSNTCYQGLQAVARRRIDCSNTAGQGCSSRPRRTGQPGPCLVVASLDYENGASADLFQHLHDHRLVRPPEVSKSAAFRGHRGELADCVCRILLPGSRKPHRLWGIHGFPVEDHSRSDHALHIHGFCVAVSR